MKNLTNMPLATKFVLGTTVGMLVVLTAHAAITFDRENTILESDRRQEGGRLAHALALTASYEWDRLGRDGAIGLLDEVNKRDPDVEIRWRSSRDLSKKWPDKGSDAPQVQEIREADLHTYFAIPGTDRGYVEVTQDLTEERAYVRNSLWHLAVAVVVILVVNALLAMVLSRFWVGRPMTKLFAMAEAVGEGDFGRRAKLGDSATKEFAELGGALNEMASRLESTEEARADAEHERSLVEEQLRHAERLTTVGKLASGVAHELGTPLNVITAHANMIVRDQVDQEGATQSAKAIVGQADRITKIVKQLLGFARRRGPERSIVDLGRLASDVTSLLQSKAKKYGIELVVPSREDDAQMAFVDPSQIEQVVINLVTNAIQASPAGSVVTVRVASRDVVSPPHLALPPDTYCIMEVSDAGPGIRPEVRKHVFEPFFTTKEVGEGTGLGLSVVHGIVRDHSGWVEVDSEPGDGATFMVYLPRGSE